MRRYLGTFADDLHYRDRFLQAFRAILAGEPWGHFAGTLSFGLEVAAGKLFFEVPGREHYWYDGATEIRAYRKTERKVVFDGFMFVGNGTRQWQEPFRASIVDKRITKQGIWLTMEIGEDLALRAEGDIMVLLRRRDE